VTRRFGTIIGEHESESLLYRLAVVVNKIPHFVARSQSSNAVMATNTSTEDGAGAGPLTDAAHTAIGGVDGSALNTDKNQNNGHGLNSSNGNGSTNNLVEKEKSKKDKVPSVWERVTEKYRYSEAINHLRNKVVMNSAKAETRFPQLGIQRSVTAATNASGIR
jgi:hypothetical protein